MERYFKKQKAMAEAVSGTNDTMKAGKAKP